MDRARPSEEELMRGAPVLAGLFFLGCVVQLALGALVGALASRVAPFGLAMSLATLAAMWVPGYAFVRVLRSRRWSWSDPKPGEVHPVLVITGVLVWGGFTVFGAYFVYLWILSIPSV